MLGRYWVLWSKGFCSILLRSFRSPWSSIQIDVAFCVTCRNFVLFEVPVDVYSYSLSVVLWSTDEPWKQLARFLSWMDNRITNTIGQRHSALAGHDHLQHRWTISVFQSCLEWQRVLWWCDGKNKSKREPCRVYLFVLRALPIFVTFLDCHCRNKTFRVVKDWIHVHC